MVVLVGRSWSCIGLEVEFLVVFDVEVEVVKVVVVLQNCGVVVIIL